MNNKNSDILSDNSIMLNDLLYEYIPIPEQILTIFKNNKNCIFCGKPDLSVEETKLRTKKKKLNIKLYSLEEAKKICRVLN